MSALQANGITLEYESLGDEGAPVIVLVMGLGMQLIAWPMPFWQALAAAGYRVIRFDNRDSGLSTRIDTAGLPKYRRGIHRLLDAGRGEGFAIGLAILSTAQGPVGLAMASAVIGAGMGLYDAAFATLAGLFGREARGPIPAVTLIAGFASTICWPLTALPGCVNPIKFRQCRRQRVEW